MDLLDKYKLGKQPHTDDPADLMLGNYLDADVVKATYQTAIDDALGEYDSSEGIADSEWGMLLNDSLGDCVPAGLMHMQFVLARLGGHHFGMTDQAAELNYEKMGGYVPGDSSTDQGCDMRVAAKVFQKEGLIDYDGQKHHSGLYVFLEPGNVEELFFAVKEFKGAALGYRLPQSVMEQTDAAEEAGEPPIWTYEADSPEVGGHCVPGFGRQQWVTQVLPSGLVVFKSVSWGRPVGVSEDLIKNKMDSGFIVVSSSILKDGQIEGLDHQKMLHDAEALGVN